MRPRPCAVENADVAADDYGAQLRRFNAATACAVENLTYVTCAARP